MAPNGRTSRRSSPRKSRTTAPPATKRRSTHLRKKLGKKPKNQEVSATASPPPSTPPSSTSSSSDNKPDNGAGTGGSCSTPKARRFRIPAISTCPPAPKKQRVASKNCLLQRRPIAFFAHPDIELFFNFAFRELGKFSYDPLILKICAALGRGQTKRPDSN